MGQCVSNETRDIIRGHQRPMKVSRSTSGGTTLSSSSRRSSNKRSTYTKKAVPSKRETMKANIDVIPMDMDFNEGCVLLSIVVDVWRQTGFDKHCAVYCDLQQFWTGFVVSYTTNPRTGRITKLKCGNMNMVYELPSIVSRLQELTSLNLINCTYLPYEICHLTKLEELLLISCQMELFLNLPDFAPNQQQQQQQPNTNTTNDDTSKTSCASTTSTPFVALKSISLQASHFLSTPKVFHFITRQLPTLEKLCIRWENKDESTQVFRALSDDHPDTCVTFRQSLKSFYVGYCYLDEHDVFLLHSTIIPKYPHLTSIVIPSNRIGDLREVEDKVKANTKFRTLQQQSRASSNSLSQMVALRSSSPTSQALLIAPQAMIPDSPLTQASQSPSQAQDFLSMASSLSSRPASSRAAASQVYHPAIPQTQLSLVAQASSRVAALKATRSTASSQQAAARSSSSQSREVSQTVASQPAPQDFLSQASSLSSRAASSRATNHHPAIPQTHLSLVAQTSSRAAALRAAQSPSRQSQSQAARSASQPAAPDFLTQASSLSSRAPSSHATPASQVYRSAIPQAHLSLVAQASSRAAALKAVQSPSRQSQSQARSSSSQSQSRAASSSSRQSQSVSDHDATTSDIHSGNSGSGSRAEKTSLPSRTQSLSEHDASSGNDIITSMHESSNTNNFRPATPPPLPAPAPAPRSNSPYTGHNSGLEVYSTCDNSSIGTFDEYKVYEDATVEKEPSFFVTHTESNEKARVITPPLLPPLLDKNENNKKKNSNTSPMTYDDDNEKEEKNDNIVEDDEITIEFSNEDEEEEKLDMSHDDNDLFGVWGTTLEGEDTKIAHIHCHTNDSFEGGEEKKSGDSIVHHNNNNNNNSFGDEKKNNQKSFDSKYESSIPRFGTEKKKEDNKAGFNYNETQAYYQAHGTTTTNDHDQKDDDESSIPKSLQLFVQDIDDSFIESKNAYWA